MSKTTEGADNGGEAVTRVGKAELQSSFQGKEEGIWCVRVQNLVGWGSSERPKILLKH